MEVRKETFPRRLSHVSLISNSAAEDSGKKNSISHERFSYQKSKTDDDNDYGDDDNPADQLSTESHAVETITTIEGRVEHILDKDDEQSSFPHGNLYICCDFYRELRHPLLNELDQAEREKFATSSTVRTDQLGTSPNGQSPSAPSAADASPFVHATNPTHLNLQHREVSYVRKNYPSSLTHSNTYEILLIRDGDLFYRKMQFNPGIQSSTLLCEYEVDAKMRGKFKIKSLLVNKQETVLLGVCSDKTVLVYSINENFEVKFVSFLASAELSRAHKWTISNDGCYVAYMNGFDEVHVIPLPSQNKSQKGSSYRQGSGSNKSLFSKVTVYEPKELNSREYHVASVPAEDDAAISESKNSENHELDDEDVDFRDANPLRPAPSGRGIGRLSRRSTLSRAPTVRAAVGNLLSSSSQDADQQSDQGEIHFQFTIPESRVNILVFEDLDHLFIGASNGAIFWWNHSAAILETFPKVHRKGITCMSYISQSIRDNGDEQSKPKPEKTDNASPDYHASDQIEVGDIELTERANADKNAEATFDVEHKCTCRLVTGSFDRNIIVWDANPLHRRQLLILSGHVATISSVAITPDLNIIFSGGLDGSVLMWDAIMGATLRDFGKLKINMKDVIRAPTDEIAGDDADPLVKFDPRYVSESTASKPSNVAAIIPIEKYISEVRLMGVQGEMLMFSRFDGRVFMLSYDYSPRVISAKANILPPLGIVNAPNLALPGDASLASKAVDKIFINDEFRVIVASLNDGTVIIRDMDSHSQTVFTTAHNSLLSPNLILSKDGQLHLFSFKFPSRTPITSSKEAHHRNAMINAGVAGLPRLPSQHRGLGLIGGHDEELCMQVFHPSLNPIRKLPVSPLAPVVSPCGSLIVAAYHDTIRVFRSAVDAEDDCFLAEDFMHHSTTSQRNVHTRSVFAIVQIAISKDMRFIATVQAVTYAITIWMYVDVTSIPREKGPARTKSLYTIDNNLSKVSFALSDDFSFAHNDEEAASFFWQQQHNELGGGSQFYDYQSKYIWHPVWTQSGHRDQVNVLHFVKHNQKLYLCSTSDDWTVVVWEIDEETGQGSMLCTFRDHNDAVLAICCFSETPIAISGDAGGNIKIWNYVTGSKNRTFKISYKSKLAITSIALSDSCYPLVVVGTSTGEIFAYYEVHLKSLFRLQDAEQSFTKDQKIIEERIGFISIPNILSYFQEKARKRQVDWKNFYESSSLVREVALRDSMLFCNNLVHHIVIYDNAWKLLEEILRVVPHALLLRCNRFTNDKERKMKETTVNKGDDKKQKNQKDQDVSVETKVTVDGKDKNDNTAVPTKGNLKSMNSMNSFDSGSASNPAAASFPRMGPVRRASMALFASRSGGSTQLNLKEKPKQTFQQVYKKENQGCSTLLNRAIEKDCVNNIRVILDAYIRILTPHIDDEDVPSAEFWANNSCRKTHSPFLGDDVAEFLQMGPHLSDEISIFELCKVAKLYPVLFLDFVKRLVIVRNYMIALSKDRMTLKQQYLLKPSVARTTKNFWSKYEDVYPTRWEMFVHEFNQFLQTLNLSNLRTCFKLAIGKKIKSHDVAVIPYLVPIPDIAAMDSPFLRTLVMAADQIDDTSVFTNEVVKVIIAFKWKYFVKRKFTIDFLINLTYFLTYLYTFLTFREEDNLEGRLLLWFILLVLLGYLMFREVIQLFSGKLENDVLATKQLQELSFFRRWRGRIIAYVTNLWNLFNNLSYGIMLYSIILQIRYFMLIRFQEEDGGSADDESVLRERMWLKKSATAVAAAALPCFIPNLLYYLSGFTMVGPTIRKIIKITNAVMFFLGIIVLITVTFAASFNLLFPDMNGNFGTFIASVLTVIQFMNGVEFDHPNASQFPELDVILRILYMGAVNIILLNLLIAIMGDVQTQVDENAEGETGNARAKIVLEYEDLMILWSDWNIVRNRSRFKEYFPKWIQILGKEDSFISNTVANSEGKIKIAED